MRLIEDAWVSWKVKLSRNSIIDASFFFSEAQHRAENIIGNIIDSNSCANRGSNKEGVVCLSHQEA